MFGFTKINLLFHYYFYFNAVNQERKSLRSKYLAPKVDNLKSTKPSQWWNAVNRIAGMVPCASSDSILSSLRSHVEVCARYDKPYPAAPWVMCNSLLLPWRTSLGPSGCS